MPNPIFDVGFGYQLSSKYRPKRQKICILVSGFQMKNQNWTIWELYLFCPFKLVCPLHSRFFLFKNRAFCRPSFIGKNKMAAILYKTIQKLCIFGLDFEYFWQNGDHFIKTIQNPDHSIKDLYEIRTRPDFRSPFYFASPIIILFF